MHSRTTAPHLRPVFYYIFDVLVLAGPDVTRQPLEVRRALLETKILPKLRGDSLRPSPVLEGDFQDVCTW